MFPKSIPFAACALMYERNEAMLGGNHNQFKILRRFGLPWIYNTIHKLLTTLRHLSSIIELFINFQFSHAFHALSLSLSARSISPWVCCNDEKLAFHRINGAYRHIRPPRLSPSSEDWDPDVPASRDKISASCTDWDICLSRTEAGSRHRWSPHRRRRCGRFCKSRTSWHAWRTPDATVKSNFPSRIACPHFR